jgi:hypothetical protein
MGRAVVDLFYAARIVRGFDADVKKRAEAEAKEMGLPPPTLRDFLMDPFPCPDILPRRTDPAIERHLSHAEDV